MDILKALVTNSNTTKLDIDEIRDVGNMLKKHTNPAPMPGYGQIFINGNKVWYVGGDGDEDGFHKLVNKELMDVPGVKEVIYEAEKFPNRDIWEQVYPKKG